MSVMIPIYMRHGALLGRVTQIEEGWQFVPFQDEACAGMAVETFFTKEEMDAAIDAHLGPQGIAEVKAKAAAHMRKAHADRAREVAQAKADAEARSYVGENYEEGRPLKETAKLIQAAVSMARDEGLLPWDIYRVRTTKDKWGTPIVTVNTWHFWDMNARHKIEDIALSFNFREGRLAGDDRMAFQLKFRSRAANDEKRARDTTPPAPGVSRKG
jgi:hypothetical protein